MKLPTYPKHGNQDLRSSGCVTHEQSASEKGKDDQNHYIDTLDLEVFVAGLQDEVAYVSQTWESSLT